MTSKKIGLLWKKYNPKRLVWATFSSKLNNFHSTFHYFYFQAFADKKLDSAGCEQDQRKGCEPIDEYDESESISDDPATAIDTTTTTISSEQ